jgi:hypothetical protein
MSCRLGRNEHCHCSSGKKYKKCCLEKEDVRTVIEKSYTLFMSAALDGEEQDQILAFHHFFPDIAEKENRAFWANGRDPKCDCNRVIVAVVDIQKPKHGTILSVGFAFDRKDPDAGPYIDPLNHLTKEGGSVYPLMENMLQTDLEYVARLKRHYNLVKNKIKSNSNGPQALN